jgi:TM2 domain-containing membrane protein YozV
MGTTHSVLLVVALFGMILMAIVVVITEERSRTKQLQQNSNPLTSKQKLFVSLYGKNRTTVFILSLLLGHLGIDRLYLGHIGLGLLKMFTFGGLGLWWFLDLFFIMGATDRENGKLLTLYKDVEEGA